MAKKVYSKYDAKDIYGIAILGSNTGIFWRTESQRKFYLKIEPAIEVLQKMPTTWLPRQTYLWNMIFGTRLIFE